MTTEAPGAVVSGLPEQRAVVPGQPRLQGLSIREATSSYEGPSRGEGTNEAYERGI